MLSTSKSRPIHIPSDSRFGLETGREFESPPLSLELGSEGAHGPELFRSRVPPQPEAGIAGSSTILAADSDSESTQATPRERERGQRPVQMPVTANAIALSKLNERTVTRSSFRHSADKRGGPRADPGLKFGAEA